MNMKIKEPPMMELQTNIEAPIKLHMNIKKENTCIRNETCKNNNRKNHKQQPKPKKELNLMTMGL